MHRSPFLDMRAAVFVAALSAIGCEDADPLDPRGRVDQRASNSAVLSGQVGPITLDDHFAEIAKQLPAFAGMFQRGDSLIVALTDIGASALVARSVVPAYASGHRIDGIAAAHRLPLSYVQVSNSFATLRYWYDQLNGRGLPPDVISVDINEQTNRLTLGAATTSDATRVFNTLRGWGFPEHAIATEVVTPPAPAQNLGDYIRPLVGGIKIQTNHLGNGKTGTLGFTAYRYVGSVPDSSTKYIITISHITTTQFGNDGVAFWNCPGALNRSLQHLGEYRQCDTSSGDSLCRVVEITEGD